MRFFSLFVILLCLFGPVDSKGAARWDSPSPQSSDCSPEGGGMVPVGAGQCNGEENLPYWCTFCLDDSDQCASPTRTGIDYIKVRVMTGRL